MPEPLTEVKNPGQEILSLEVDNTVYRVARGVDNQRDQKGLEFQTWSGSGPKCQKRSGIGPNLGTRSGFGFLALVF